MNRRNLFKSLFGAAGAAVGLLLAPSKQFMDSISKWPSGSYRTYIMGDSAILFDKDIVSTLKRDDSLFEALSSRRTIPMNTGVTREFFQYEALS